MNFKKEAPIAQTVQTIISWKSIVSVLSSKLSRPAIAHTNSPVQQLCAPNVQCSFQHKF